MATATRRASKIPAQTQSAAEEPEERRRINGQLVVKDEPVESPLTRASRKPVYFNGLRLLTLEDGTQVVGCTDCPETGTRGAIMKHRSDHHGVRRGGAPRGAPTKTKAPVAEQLAPDISHLTVGQFTELLRDAGRWPSMFDALQAQHDEWKARAQRAEQEHRKLIRAMERIGFVPVAAVEGGE